MKHGGQTRHKYPVAEHCRSREQAQTRCGVATSSISNNLLSRDYRVLSKPGQERNYRNYERETSVVHMRRPSIFHQLSHEFGNLVVVTKDVYLFSINRGSVFLRQIFCCGEIDRTMSCAWKNEGIRLRKFQLSWYCLDIGMSSTQGEYTH